MITLSNVTSGTKAVLKWGGIGLGAIILIWMLFGLGGIIKSTFFPTPPPPPTVAFGKIESIKFPAQTEIKDLTYVIDTVTGSVPNFSDRAKVFKIKQPEANLLALDNATKKLNSIGFNTQPIPLGGNIYKWTDTSSILRTISFDILSSNFNLTSSFLQDPDIVSGRNLPDTVESIVATKDFLKRLDNYPTDLDETKTKTNLFSIINSNIVPASSLSNAQLIQVFYFQKDVDGIPIYYSNPKESSMSIIIAGGSPPQVIQAGFNHQTISNINETYPIKTGEQAFEELQKGNAFIAAYGGLKKIISVKKISLGYFVQNDTQQYLIPIYVFEGNDNFVAYLPAVTDEWLSK
jgi:hypothetical protein